MSQNIKKHIVFAIISLMALTSCKGLYKYSDARENPVRGEDRARKNIEEGRGVSVGGLVKGRMGKTTYEFSTSNPMWRASLEVLDFLPMTTVDYSGGMIISDWYTDNNSDNESIKITIRFLSNEIRSDSLKIIVHKKICPNNSTACKVNILNDNKISQELRSTIIKKASLLQEESKKKKK